MKTYKLNFPIVAFSKSVVHYARDKAEITICSRIALRNGLYTNMQIIDCDGAHYHVINALKLGTVGPLWGLNIFLNQKIRIELNFSDEVSNVSLEDFKRIILSAITEQGDSDGMYNQKIASIRRATTIREIIEMLAEQYYRRYK